MLKTAAGKSNKKSGGKRNYRVLFHRNLNEICFTEVLILPLR